MIRYDSKRTNISLSLIVTIMGWGFPQNTSFTEMGALPESLKRATSVYRSFHVLVVLVAVVSAAGYVVAEWFRF